MLYFNPELFDEQLYEEIWDTLQDQSEESYFLPVIQQLEETLTISSNSQKKRILGELAVRHIIYKEFQFITLLNLKGETEIHNEMQAVLAEHVKDAFSVIYSDLEDLNTCVFHISEMIFYQTVKPKPLTISVQIVRKSVNRNQLIQLLVSIFGENNLQFVNNNNVDVDIVVTDIYVDTISKKKTYFYLSNSNDPNIIQNLIKHIQTMLIGDHVISY